MIIFRADANPRIGSGHIMRCLSIADSLKNFGEDSLFVTADDAFTEKIVGRGYEVKVLQSAYNEMEEEIPRMRSILAEYGADMLIVDSYFVNSTYLSSLKHHVKLAYIDDLAAFPYPVNILINYNIYASEVEYRDLYKNSSVIPDKCLLGPKFVPLRSEFKDVASKKQSDKDIYDVLISTGGSDPIYLSLNLLKAISKRPYGGLHYHILVGGLNSDKQKIDEMARSMPNVSLHKDVQNMSELISSCDIAVSAGGSTLYEICACKLPLITYVIADNQKKGAQAFEEAGLAISCGDLRNDPQAANKIMKAISDTIEHLEKRESPKVISSCDIDGYGADRLARELISSIEK